MEIETPQFVTQQTNIWRETDRVTWNEKSFKDVRNISDEILATFEAELRELKQWMVPLPRNIPSPLIHADLTGNVLFDDRPGDLPGIIDMTFYWRPTASAEAIVVAGGLTWHEQGEALIASYGTDKVGLQLLLRAIYWRCITFAIDPDMDWIRANIQIFPWPTIPELSRLYLIR
jgi:hypothetical protein